MPGSLRLGKIAGIAVYAHLSWLILLVLLTWSLASDWFAQVFPGWGVMTYWVTAFSQPCSSSFACSRMNSDTRLSQEYMV